MASDIDSDEVDHEILGPPKTIGRNALQQTKLNFFKQQSMLKASSTNETEDVFSLDRRGHVPHNVLLVA